MTDSDAIAAAILAAARCAALGTNNTEAYFKQFTEFEGLFEQHRAAQKAARAKGANDVWAGLEK